MINFQIFYAADHSRFSSSLMLQRSSLLFENLDAREIGFQPLTVNCSNAGPKPEREESHFIRVSSGGL